LPEDPAAVKALLLAALTERDRAQQQAREQAQRADRLQAPGELAQALLNFGEELEQQPVHPEDVAAGSAPASEGRRVKRRR
jgi:hypothetical protein